MSKLQGIKISYTFSGQNVSITQNDIPFEDVFKTS